MSIEAAAFVGFVIGLVVGFALCCFVIWEPQSRSDNQADPPKYGSGFIERRKP